MKHKGVTAEISTVLLLGIVTASAGTYYTLQDDVTQSGVSQDQSVIQDAPIAIESCWVNQTGTHFRVRNSQKLYVLDTNTTEIVIDGTPYNPTINKEKVEPLDSYTVSIDKLMPDGINVRIRNEEYWAENFCQTLAPSPEADFSYDPILPVEKSAVTSAEEVEFTQDASGRITDYEWYLGSNTDGTPEDNGENWENTFQNSGTYDVTLNVSDIRNRTDQETKTVKVLNVGEFGVKILEDNSPIKEGQTFNTTYMIRHAGEAEAEKTASLTIEGKGQKDQNEHTLGNLEKEEDTLQWSTNEGDKGTYTYNISTPDDTAQDTVKVIDKDALLEPGGEDDATITYINSPGNASLTGPRTTSGFGGGGSTTLCLGRNCTDSTGKPTDLDEDRYVNETGDEMDGTLNTGAVNITKKLCIGKGCDAPTDPDGPALNNDTNKDTTKDFKLETPALRPIKDSICFGTTC